MRSQPQASPDDIDIASLWSVMKKNATKIFATSAVMGLGTFGILMLIPSKYTSDAKIEIGGPGITDPFGQKSASNQAPESLTIKVDKEAVASQVQVLQSPNLANKLMKELQLASQPEFNSELSQGFTSGLLRMAGLAGPRDGETEEERVLAAYFKALRVFQVKDTRIITVEFSASDTDLAAKAANRLVELYQDELRTRQTSTGQAAEKWLKPQIEKLEKEATEADAEVERFSRQADIFTGKDSGTSTGRGGLDEQRLTELTSEVTKVQAARSEAESRARTARELMQRGSVDAIPEVQKSPVIQALIAQRTRAEREKAEADTSLLSGHPRMKQLNANVADLKRQVTKEASTIVDGLEREAKGLALREELAAKSLTDMKSRVGSKSGDNVKLATLKSQAKSKRIELDSLQEKYEKAKIVGNRETAAIEAVIVSTARPSSVPSSPKRAMLSALASAAGLILGFALVILKELFAGSRGGGHMQSGARQSSAGRMGSGQMGGMTEPAFGAASLASQAAPAAAAAAARVIRQPAPQAAASAPVATSLATAPSPSADAASITAIAHRLIGNAQSQGGYRTVITGSAAGIVTHEEALDLAAAITAQGKQVALVDWSVDGRGLSEQLGLEPAPGLMDLLDGRASFEDVIRRMPEADVHVVPCGTAQVGTKALNPDRVNLVLDALDEAYDHIIVTGEHDVIRDLFQAIQGRFDAGVAIADPRHPTAAGESGDSIFLGFQVTDIDILRIDRGGDAAARRKMQLARSNGPEARA